jgi:GxxExxY protein
MSRRVIGLANEVHSQLGPGMLESTYEKCLCMELDDHRIPFVRQKTLSAEYKSRMIDQAFRIDIVVAEELVIEVKAVQLFCPCTRRSFSVICDSAATRSVCC